MAVLITGGAGFIGSHTAVEFLEKGYDLVILDNFANSKPCVLERIKEISGKDFRFYQIDLLDKAALDKMFDECPDIDSCIHFAGLKAVGESVRMPLAYYHNNLTGTINLCNSMAEHGVKTLVFSSSATVYGDPATVPIREDFPTGNTTNPDGETKHMIERILKDVHHADPEWSISILRYFNPIGAHESGKIGEDPNGIPNNLLPYITQVASGKREFLSVYGNDYDTHDGTGVRDYIHVVDLSLAHLHALELAYKEKGIEYFNIGTGNGYSVLDVVHAFEKVTGKPLPYRIVDRRPGDIATCYADPAKAERMLGWKAKYDINRMCEDAYRWQTMNPNGYGE